MPSFLSPILKDPERPVQLVKAGDARAIATTVLTAFDSASRRTGLLKRDHLPPQTALIIAPCSGVHTFGMRFTIDVAFVTREGRIVKIRRQMPRRRMAFALGAFAVIEMAAGALDGAGVREGDTVALESLRGV